MKILFLGDIVGRPGRHACIERIRDIKRELEIDAVIANAENASGGNGLTVKNADELLESGIDFITSGNHIWRQKDFPELFQTFPNVIRPANYPDDVPGRGWGILELEGGDEIGIINLQGRVFMDPIDCPFRAVDRMLPEIAERTKIILVDIHAEATSEKTAMGIYLDGRVSGVMGTHTHVASADERILPGGTAYQTDIGMVGPIDGVLGVESEPVIKRFLTGLPYRFSVAEGPVTMDGTLITIDPETGKAPGIERFKEIHEPALKEEGYAAT